MKKSLRPYSLYFLTKLMAKIPMLLYLSLANWTTEKVTIVFSNVAGPKTPIIYGESQCRKIAFLLPALGKLSCGLSLLSTADCMKIGFLCDQNICDEPQELIDIIESTLALAVNEVEEHILEMSSRASE